MFKGYHLIHYFIKNCIRASTAINTGQECLQPNPQRYADSMMYKLMVVCVMVALMLRHGEASERSERSVVTFGLMVKCGTQYGLNLNGYGCWCGLGNKGRPHSFSGMVKQVLSAALTTAHREVEISGFFTTSQLLPL